VGKTKFHKSHHFDKDEDVTLMVGESKPGIGGERLPCQRMPAPHSSIPPGDSFDLPSWVAFDKQVLSFDGYFQESVTESRTEQYRVRHVKVYFYLEDDSIQVVEPRHKNSGLNQGTISTVFVGFISANYTDRDCESYMERKLARFDVSCESRILRIRISLTRGEADMPIN